MLFYKYQNFEDKDYYDYLITKEIFNESEGIYRYWRITEDLKIKYVVIFNHQKALIIINKYELKLKYVRKNKNNLIKE